MLCNILPYTCRCKNLRETRTQSARIVFTQDKVMKRHIHDEFGVFIFNRILIRSD